MSSSSDPPSGGNDSPFRPYYCRHCLNLITLNPSLTSPILCPICPHELIEIFDVTTFNLRPINPDTEPFISRKVVLEHLHPNDDYIYVVTNIDFFICPYPNSFLFLTPLPTDDSFISFRSLCQYMNNCLNEGASINSLSWSAIEWLPDVKMTEDVVASCTVCTEDFKIGEEAKQLPCRHLYHKDCIFSWVEQRATCPVCRLKLTTDLRFSSVTSGAMGGSAEQIFAEHRADNVPTMFDIELRWPINSRFSGSDESAEDFGSNEASESEEQENIHD